VLLCLKLNTVKVRYCKVKYCEKLTRKICLLETKYRFWRTMTMDNDLFCIEILLQFFLL